MDREGEEAVKIRLTKNFILKALREEPLKGLSSSVFLASVLASDGDGGRTVGDPNCISCAVGTIVKHALDPSTSVMKASRRVIDRLIRRRDGGCDLYGWGVSVEAPETFVADDPWRALSVVYESACNSGSYARGRRAAIRFVEKHFPSHVVLDIDGIAPNKARGLTVLG